MDNPNFDYFFQEIPETFLNESKYIMHKSITDFTRDDEFLGDFYHSIIYEPGSDGVPLIHSVASPFDLVTKKAPETVLTFRDGKCLLNSDFTEWVKVRTGIMDAVLTRSLDLNPAEGRVLYIGTGGTASWSLRALAHSFPDLQEVDYLARANARQEFIEAAEASGVKLQRVSSLKLENYDFVFCHTNTDAPVITKGSTPKVGALMTTFISSTEHGEVDDSFYRADANVIWSSPRNPDTWIRAMMLPGGSPYGKQEDETAVLGRI